MSGTGSVAEGCEFWDGSCVLRWTTEVRSSALYASVDDLEYLHGHNGNTRIKWIDGEEPDPGFRDGQERTAYREALERVGRAWQKGVGLNETMRQVMVLLAEYDA